MTRKRFFRWTRVVAVGMLLGVAFFWVRSYWRVDAVNYRTTGGEQVAMRSQDGRMVFEAADVSEEHLSARVWFYSTDDFLGLEGWASNFFEDKRHEGLGFVWIRGSYVTPTAPPHGYERGFIFCAATAVAVPFWFLGVWPVLFLVRAGWLLWRGRRREGCCENCGYDLRATPVRCPECGWEVPVVTP